MQFLGANGVGKVSIANTLLHIAHLI